jgi:hypothetical protein
MCSRQPAASMPPYPPYPSPRPPGDTTLTTTQRWTLAVVCVATAMLMLDIAVVNTALSDIAADLKTGLSGLQWVGAAVCGAGAIACAALLADRREAKPVTSPQARQSTETVPADVALDAA